MSNGEAAVDEDDGRALFVPDARDDASVGVVDRFEAAAGGAADADAVAPVDARRGVPLRCADGLLRTRGLAVRALPDAAPGLGMEPPADAAAVVDPPRLTPAPATSDRDDDRMGLLMLFPRGTAPGRLDRGPVLGDICRAAGSPTDVDAARGARPPGGGVSGRREVPVVEAIPLPPARPAAADALLSACSLHRAVKRSLLRRAIVA